MPIDSDLRQQANDATQSHWNQFPDPLSQDRIKNYIQEVLPLEMQLLQ